MTLNERLKVFWGTKVFELLELHLGDVLEMIGCLVVTLGGDCMVTVEISWDRALEFQ